jgi:predicted metal-dependent hydrolase
MIITEIVKPRTPASIPQGVATRKMYGTEKQIIEKIWGMNRPRSLKNIQVAFKLLWDHYSPLYNVYRKMPEVQFGPGTKYRGRYLSYTIARERGQPWLIELAPGQRNFYVLIHELAHALGPVQHGVKFAEVYHDLLSHETFKDIMSSQLGQKFLNFLKSEHPEFVKKAYRSRY